MDELTTLVFHSCKKKCNPQRSIKMWINMIESRSWVCLCPLGMVQRMETPLSATTKQSATQSLCNL